MTSSHLNNWSKNRKKNSNSVQENVFSFYAILIDSFENTVCFNRYSLHLTKIVMGGAPVMLVKWP